MSGVKVSYLSFATISSGSLYVDTRSLVKMCILSVIKSIPYEDTFTQEFEPVASGNSFSMRTLSYSSASGIIHYNFHSIYLL